MNMIWCLMDRDRPLHRHGADTSSTYRQNRCFDRPVQSQGQEGPSDREKHLTYQANSAQSPSPTKPFSTLV